jgi:hypothetical protein
LFLVRIIHLPIPIFRDFPFVWEQRDRYAGFLAEACGDLAYMRDALQALQGEQQQQQPLQQQVLQQGQHATGEQAQEKRSEQPRQAASSSSSSSSSDGMSVDESSSSLSSSSSLNENLHAKLAEITERAREQREAAERELSESETLMRQQVTDLITQCDKCMFILSVFLSFRFPPKSIKFFTFEISPSKSLFLWCCLLYLPRVQSSICSCLRCARTRRIRC